MYLSMVLASVPFWAAPSEAWSFWNSSEVWMFSTFTVKARSDPFLTIGGMGCIILEKSVSALTKNVALSPLASIASPSSKLPLKGACWSTSFTGMFSLYVSRSTESSLFLSTRWNDIISPILAFRASLFCSWNWYFSPSSVTCTRCWLQEAARMQIPSTKPIVLRFIGF